MRTRNHRFSLWLNEKELFHLSRQADLAGLKKEPFLRKLIMEQEVRPRPPDEYAKILRQLSAIGNNVNQLAYKANGLGVIYVTEVREVRKALDRVWEEIKKI